MPEERGRAAVDLRGWLERFVREEGFLARYPYYAHVVAALECVIDPSYPLIHPIYDYDLKHRARAHVTRRVPPALVRPHYLTLPGLNRISQRGMKWSCASWTKSAT